MMTRPVYIRGVSGTDRFGVTRCTAYGHSKAMEICDTPSYRQGDFFQIFFTRHFRRNLRETACDYFFYRIPFDETFFLFMCV